MNSVLGVRSRAFSGTTFENNPYRTWRSWCVFLREHQPGTLYEGRC